VADAFFEVGNFRLQRRNVLRVVFQRFDDLVETSARS
jgi:hypothetical protein